jgi:hypothetical protein
VLRIVFERDHMERLVEVITETDYFLSVGDRASDLRRNVG